MRHGPHRKRRGNVFPELLTSNNGERDTQTQRQHGNLIRLLLLFQNKESGLKMLFLLLLLLLLVLFFLMALQPQWALAYLHETLRFTSVFFSILDNR
jgi:hypothetical protein